MKMLTKLAMVALIYSGSAIMAMSISEKQKQIFTQALQDSAEQIKALKADVESAKRATLTTTPQVDTVERPYLKKEEWERITKAKLALEEGLTQKINQLQTQLASSNIEMQKQVISLALTNNAEQLKHDEQIRSPQLIMESGRVAIGDAEKKLEVERRLQTLLNRLKEVTVATKGQALQEAIAESMAQIEALKADVENAKKATSLSTPQFDTLGNPHLKKEEWERITKAKLTLEEGLLKKLQQLQTELHKSNMEKQKEIIGLELAENAEQLKNAEQANKRATKLLNESGQVVKIGETDKRLEVATRLQMTLQQIKNELMLSTE